MTRSTTTTTRLRPVGDSAVLEQWAYTRFGDLLLLCATGESSPPDSDVEAWIARLAKRDANKILLHAKGGQPDAKQRGMLNEHFNTRGAPLPCAILTDSLIARSVMTAIGWVSKVPNKAFELNDVEGALEWLGVPALASQVRPAIVEMQGALKIKKRAP